MQSWGKVRDTSNAISSRVSSLERGEGDLLPPLRLLLLVLAAGPASCQEEMSDSARSTRMLYSCGVRFNWKQKHTQGSY